MTSSAALAVQVRSVNAGRPRRLGVHQHRVVRSAIHKGPVEDGELHLTELNLQGDEQADRRVHGGLDKALYAYPVEHLDAWTRELRIAGHQVDGLFLPGAIGENLTIAGWDEVRACIGDVWQWGEALVQVAQPRQPCFKLALRTGIPLMVRRFQQTGRCGWYLRVLRPGMVPARTPLTLTVIHRDRRSLSVGQAQGLLQRRAARHQLAEAIEHPALAGAWRRALQRRLTLVDNRVLA